MSNARVLRNIALTGFMGTGKSSVGRHIAELLRFEFFDTDELIEQRVGKSITRIFSEDGEAVFRQWESEIVAHISTFSGGVFATGGGLGANEQNMARLKEHSLVVCLWASPEKIWDRVRHQSHRPLLLQTPDPLAKIRELLAAREAVYKQADVLLNTELRTIREVSQQAVLHFHGFARKR